MRRLTVTSGKPGRSRWATVREPVLDTALAALMWVVMGLDLATRPLAAGQSPSTPAAYVWVAAIAAPLIVHRRWPLLAMAVSNVALIGYSLGRYSAFPGYATFALVFAVALHAGRRRALVGYLGGAAGLGMALLLQPAEVADASSWISTLLTVTVAWLAGANLRSRRARRRHELDEAHRQVLQQAEQARRAISAERLRIARDLHDVIAHSLSVIAVQAGVAHHVVDERPDVARDALGTIETTAREGLVEMRRLLGLLRSESPPAEHAGSDPVEGLRDLDRLLGHFRAAGLHVDVAGATSVGDLPPALDVTAYRIVQEGLTNVLRHGGPAARLRLQRRASELCVEITDDGRSDTARPPAPGSGHGLAGIRERAALFNGTVHAGPQPGGGFRLAVELPIRPSVTAR